MMKQCKSIRSAVSSDDRVDDLLDTAVRKFRAASADVWSEVQQDKNSFNDDVRESVKQYTPADIVDQIISGIPGFLHGELQKRSVDFDKIADRTLSRVDKELTPQPDHAGI